VLLGGAAAWPLAARAQQGERLRRVGVLETISAELNATNFEALRKGEKDCVTSATSKGKI